MGNDRLTATQIYGYAVVPSKVPEALDKLGEYEDLGTPSEVAELVKENKDLRNGLCLRCGKYQMAHEGACDGCRWRKEAL